MALNKINYLDHKNSRYSPFYQQWIKDLILNKKKTVSTTRKIKMTKHSKNRSFMRNTNISKKLYLISLFKAFFQRSSIHILNRIGNSGKWQLKAFWFIILIIGIIGCLSQIGQFLASYYSYGVVVNLESIKPNYLVFPGVTICNINSFRREFEPCVKHLLSYHECFGLNDTNEEVYDNKNITLPECTIDMRDFQNVKGSRLEWIYLLISQKVTNRMKFGHQFSDLVRVCVYNGWNCTSGDFKMSVSHLYGNCYTFNSKDDKYLTTEFGPVSGLELELDLEVDKYSTMTQTAGARVEIHDPHLEHRVDVNGIFLSPGYSTHIAVTKQIISRLPSPYKDHCRNYTLRDSPENCRDLCLHNFTTSICGCTTIRHFHSGIRQCDLTDPLIMCCVNIVLNQEYLCDCPLSCEETVYNTQLSSSFWPTKTYYEENKNVYVETNGNSTPLSYDKLRENRLRINVYYDTLDYTVYRQSPMYQNSEIFSQIGGHMGLWLGMSLVFIFECLEHILMFFKWTFRHLKMLIAR